MVSNHQRKSFLKRCCTNRLVYRVCLNFIFFTVMCSCIIDSTEGGKNRKRPGRTEPDDRFEKIKNLIMDIYLIAFAPVALVFLHSLLTDPIVPEMIKMLFEKGKAKMTSNLGSKTNNLIVLDRKDVGKS